VQDVTPHCKTINLLRLM